MKMQAEHFKHLRKIICNYLSKYPISAEKYRNMGLSKERFVWDLYHHVPGAKHHKHYDYLNDNHIQTALFKIIGKY